MLRIKIQSSINSGLVGCNVIPAGMRHDGHIDYDALHVFILFYVIINSINLQHLRVLIRTLKHSLRVSELSPQSVLTTLRALAHIDSVNLGHKHVVAARVP